MTPLTTLPPITTPAAPTPLLPAEASSGDAFQALLNVLPVASNGAPVATVTPAVPAVVDVADAITPEQGARTMLALFETEADAGEKPDAEATTDRLPQALYELLTPVAPASTASSNAALPPAVLPNAAVSPTPTSAAPATAKPTAIDRRRLPPVATDQPLPLPTPIAAAPPSTAAAAPPPSGAAPAIVIQTETGEGGGAAAASTPPAPTPLTSEETKRMAPTADAAKTNSLSFLPLAVPAATPAPQIFADAVAAPQPSFADRQLDLASDTQWLDDLAKDIVSAARTDQRLSFRLLPPTLGKLDVDLAGSDAGMSVRMSTPSQEARSIIAAAQPQLISELRAQGIRIAETEVNLSDSGQRGQQGQAGQQGNSRADQPTSALIEVSIPATAHDDARDQTQPAGRFA